VKALLDTSVVIALDKPGEEPPDLSGFDSLQVASLTFSELNLGLHTTRDLATYKARSARLSAITQVLGPGLAYDDACAAAFGRIVEHVATHSGGPKARPLDRMIAATALAHGLALVTRNVAHFQGLAPLVHIEAR
jgi:predicted nucleic acid-binding protein